MRLRYYQKNPLAWMRDKLGIRPETVKWDLFPQYKNHQWDRKDPSLVTPNPLYRALKALVQHKDVGIESCTGAGKSYLAAAIALWFVDVHRKIVDENGKVIDPGGMVVTVATKEKQLEAVLWKEIGKFEEIFTEMNPTAEFQHLKVRMDADSADKESWGIFGKTAQVGADEETAQGLKGIHAPHMLFILDEVPGIHPAILESIENTCTGNHNLRLMLGNPTSQNDSLHKFCTHPDVEHIRASAYDHPNVVLGREEVPGAVTQKSIDRRLNRYGDPEHYQILSHVHGIAPETSGLTLFPGDILSKAGPYAGRDVEWSKRISGSSEGEMRIYEEVKHDRMNRYILFADVAGDRSQKGDYHAAIMFDCIERKPVAVIHMRGPRKDYITELLQLCNMYVIRYGRTGREVVTKDGETQPERLKNYPLFAYERNNVGGLHLDDRVMNYPNLYHKRSSDQPDNESIRASVGWHTNSSTRPDMMDALEDWALELRDNPERFYDTELHEECKTFVWNGSAEKWEAESGAHDDLVMALAGALTIDQIVNDRTITTDRFEPQTDERPVKRNAERFLSAQEKKKAGATAFDSASLPDFDLSGAVL